MKTKKYLDGLPPQKNVLTLSDAESRTNFWREAIKPLYKGRELPHGFFIPFEDLKEIVDDYTNQNIAGIRVYLTFAEARGIDDPLSNQIAGIMVPVRLDESVLPPAEPVYLDIIEPVVEAPIGWPPVNKDVVSIYDVTQPCPPCCDVSSPLFGAS